MLTAGFAHGSAGHITGNLLGTVVLAPIVEYAWSHYPPDQSEDDLGGVTAERQRELGLLARPWVRALVVFPVAIILVSLVTSLFAFGFSLGFSGTVFAFGGLALVYYPIRTIVGMLGISVVGLVYRALTQPVLTATADPGPPGPPSWFGINQQAHILGLLIGALLGIALLTERDRRPQPDNLLVAVLFFTIARGLYALPWTEGDKFLQYRGIGLIVVLVLTIVITAAVVSSDRRLTGKSRPRKLALGWLGLVTFGALLAAWFGLQWNATLSGTLALTGVLGGLLAIPGLYVLGITFVGKSRLTRRQAAIGVLVVVTVAVALLSVPFNLFVLADDPVPGSGSVEVKDYTVTYEENVTAPRMFATERRYNAAMGSTEEGGLIVISERREIYSVAVSKDDLARQGNASVPLGSLRWRETVTAERTGWSVTGNESVYVVDLHHDGQRTRSFVSNQSTAEPRIAGYSLTLAPAGGQFEIRVRENGTTVDSAPIPATNASTTVASLEFSVEQREGTDTLIVSKNGTRVAIAQREHE
jgi:membrane associated rhomboid family serine protease